MRPLSVRSVVVTMAVGAAASWARAGDGPDTTVLDAGPVEFTYRQPEPSPSTPPDTAPAEPVSEARPAGAFGQSGTEWLTVGGAFSYGFNGSTDLGAFGSYSYFIATDVELGAEVGLWHFNQSGDDASGLSGSLLLRWHFIDTGPWTVFADAGIGVLGSTDNVPEGGTSFNFMPRLGIGFTRQITDDGLRLEAGWRWHHISNARIHGDEHNPARDQNLLFVGLIFPF
jgi:opacity protein-like surface antigen